MSFVYTRALGLQDSTTLTGDMRALLVMSNTTADTEEDTDFIGNFTTLDEYDGANYARQALVNESFAVDTTNDRFVFDADDVVFTSLGAGTRQAVAVILYLHVTTDADSKPIYYIDTGGFPFDGNGQDATIAWNASGIAYLQNAP